MRVNVLRSGAVTFDSLVTCDGFARDYPIRVQTHVHKDHMSEFNRSKGNQDILMSSPTHELLIAEYNADLFFRSNLKAIPLSEPFFYENCQIRLLDNKHMLGSVQVEVTLPYGLRCGYSGDFAWPLDDVIEVEELVLDSTYGSPDSVRKFTQEEANNRFVDLVVEQLQSSPVFILAHRGTLQRAISCLDDAIKNPIVAGSRLYNELEVYQRHGYSLTKILNEDTEEAKLVLGERRYIRIYETRDQRPIDTGEATFITLSAYMSRQDNPITEYSGKSFCVALSGHADYEETLEYVRATGARKVMTDNSHSRGRHGVELALALRQELGVEAQPSENRYTQE